MTGHVRRRELLIRAASAGVAAALPLPALAQVTGARVVVVGGGFAGATCARTLKRLDLNPSFARGWFLSGVLRIWAGQPDLAIEHVETSLRLSPRERVGVPLWAMGAAYFFKRQFDEAAAKLLRAIQDDPGYLSSYRFLAASYAHLGRIDEARAIVAKLSDVPEEAIMSDTREPSYMFLAAEWNRSSVSERAYLLAMLFGREFEVEANDLSLQIASLAMTMVEPDGSAALIARVDLGAAD